MIDLAGRTVLVTGASRGIGRAIALRVAEAGARVLIHYGTNRDAALAVADEIGARHSDVLQADLAASGAGAALFASALEAAGGLDALVNNAGIYVPAGIDADDAAWSENWSSTWAVNVRAVADLSRAALRRFRATGGGRIVTIASRAAHRGDGSDYPAYAASKGAVVAMMKTFARARAHEKALIYTIAPGWVATEMAPQGADADALAAQEIPLGHMAQPDEIAALTAFLLSDLCPSATGATFDINGASYVR